MARNTRTRCFHTDLSPLPNGEMARDAEYIALTQLQADAFVTLDTELARSVEGIVATSSIDSLR
jgi:hypothetical protein